MDNFKEPLVKTIQFNDNQLIVDKITDLVNKDKSIPDSMRKMVRTEAVRILGIAFKEIRNSSTRDYLELKVSTDNQRYEELTESIRRFLFVNQVIPEEWIIERNNLYKTISEREDKILFSTLYRIQKNKKL